VESFVSHLSPFSCSARLTAPRDIDPVLMHFTPYARGDKKVLTRAETGGNDARRD
jgi:hypothetical protein